MKKKTLILSVLFMTTLIYSCKKEDEVEVVPTPTSTVYPNYSQLKVGNYWIYQRFEVDSLGNATPTAVYDSCYIDKDTIIDSQTYYKYIAPDPYSQQNDLSVEFLRDSLHYIISRYDYYKIRFSSQDFLTVFDTYYSMDSIYEKTRKMDDKNMSVTTPAGVFVTSNMKETIRFLNSTNPFHIRYNNHRYAENIGIIAETIINYSASPTTTERRLVRYHLN